MACGIHAYVKSAEKVDELDRTAIFRLKMVKALVDLNIDSVLIHSPRCFAQDPPTQAFIILNDRIRRSGIHHVKNRVNGLVSTGSKDGGTQYFVGLGIHYDLHKPLRLAPLNGATNLRHRPRDEPCGPHTRSRP